MDDVLIIESGNHEYFFRAGVSPDGKYLILETLRGLNVRQNFLANDLSSPSWIYRVADKQALDSRPVEVRDRAKHLVVQDNRYV